MKEPNIPTTIGAFTDLQKQVRKLVQQHRKSKKERLRLAVYLAPSPRARRDILLFEVIEGFGGDAVDPEGKLFECTYGSTPALPLAPETNLRMVLTNPTELEEAARHDWKGVETLRSARRVGRATVIHADPKGKQLWDMVK